MENGEYQNLRSSDAEYDTIIPHAKFPVSFERTPERFAVHIGMSEKLLFDGDSNLVSPERCESWNIFFYDLRVINDLEHYRHARA